MPQKFAFQRLEVYQVGKAVAQLTIANRPLWADLPGEVGARLSRAMVGLMAEIAAGAAQVGRAEQRRHYQTARAAANEVMSCVEVAQLHGAVPAELRSALTAQLARIDQMLAGMVRRRSG
jgi:four helix bundle protein